MVYPKRLVEFCRLNCVCEPGNDGERRIFGGWVKTRVLFLADSGLTFKKFRDDVGDPRSFQRSFPISLACSSPEILALKIAIELRGLGRQICAG